MAHRFTFTVEVSTERTEGKFASREDQAQAILEELEGADPSEISGIGADGDSTYEIVNWEVTSDDT
ncbi:hypothetical protein [Arthrobacter cryoconiti]|uniref:Uncharacterized protein n=1 Tax=Arthrobacter cryoconiti TaxID=748907 RepID=A0ABV8R5I7_9MICC|nr:hypothetical protein [Arthrobacter cryoconiti]MCC9069320.1 hypothetical protein [Arthrobacter cryoconiti]